MKEIIVGLDVGINVGIAILDFDGKIILLESRRGISEKEIIGIIEKYGKPVIVTSDVRDPPDSIRRIATHFGARLFTPNRDLSVEEKKELTRNFEYKNIHERDALAAVLYFLKISEPLLKKIDREVYEKIYKKFKKEVKRKVLLGESANIDEAIRDLTGRKEIVKEVYIIKKSGKEKELERKIGELRRRIRKYEEEMKKLREKLRKKEVKKEREYVILDEKLKEKVERLEKIIENLEEELKRKEIEIEKYTKYIRSEKVKIRKLSEIVEIWRYLPKNIIIDVEKIDILNKKLIKILKEINPKEIIYSEADEKDLIELEKEGFVLRKKKLTKEDILRIFSK